jgi:hypothetical protein
VISDHNLPSTPETPARIANRPSAVTLTKRLVTEENIMKGFTFIALAIAAAAFLSGCQPAATNTATNTANAVNTTNSNAAKTTAPAPTKDALMTMEKAGWEAWKNRDAKWTEENYSDKAVNFTAAGRVDKAASIKSYSEQKCEIKSYSISDDQMQMVGPDVAVLTFRAAQDYTCDGTKGPADVRAASIYVREGDKWKAAFYAETPAVDPNAPQSKSGTPTKGASPKTDEAKPDAATEAVLAQERKIWEGWKTKDTKMLDDVLGKDFMFYMGNGRHDRIGSIKMWSTDNKCDVKSYSIAEPKSSQLSSDVTLLTYKGAAEGNCEGQPIMTEWYAAVFRKEGEIWRPAFGMGVPVS